LGKGDDMFNSTVLEVAIGLTFCFASVALITSSIYEAIASGLSLRSKTLFNGIKKLLNANDTSNANLVLGIYNHALAHPLSDGKAEKIKDLSNMPSYIDSRHFALALIDEIQSAPGDFLKLGNDINAIKDEQLRKLFRGMYDNSAGKIENLYTHLAVWFDSGMDRVSGTYKRQSQLWCFVIALAVAGIFNINSLRLFESLWQHPAFIAEISVLENVENPASILQALKELPIGWDNNPTINLRLFMGWLVTASTSLFGGPFWFDLLKLFINLRGAGTKPKS
jgi:hypothetical protein